MMAKLQRKLIKFAINCLLRVEIAMCRSSMTMMVLVFLSILLRHLMKSGCLSLSAVNVYMSWRSNATFSDVTVTVRLKRFTVG